MSPGLLDTIFRRSSGAFVRAARERGIRARSARTLEAAAHEVSPGDPVLILDSRPLFEEAATRAVVGDGGNLELSFSLVDELATTVEALGLARASDVPDPFRRMWVSNGSGQRIRGVVLTCREGELAVFCPPTERSIAEIGGILWLRYRGFNSAVEYDLQLDDAVRLPGALVLHLKRRSGQGAIGRSSVRYAIHLLATLRPLDDDEGSMVEGPLSCIVTDISAGGMALECASLLEREVRVRVEVPLPDDIEASFVAEAVVRWVRDDSTGGHLVGLAFANLPRPRVERLDRFLRLLAAGEEAMGSSLPLADHRADPPPTPDPTPDPTPEATSDPAPEAAPEPAPQPTSEPAWDTAPENAWDTTPENAWDTTPVGTAEPTPQPVAKPRVPPGQLPTIRTLSFLDLDSPPADEDSGPDVRAEDDPWREASRREHRLLERIFHRISRTATDVSDHPLACSFVRGERRQSRVAGAGGIHISFKFSINLGDEEREGCLLFPLADALALVSSYLMLPVADVFGNRTLDAPNGVMKQALLQISELVAAALDREVRGVVNEHIHVRAIGCQGVRANVRPAFEYVEGAELLVGRSEASFAEFDPFELILMLPSLESR